MSNQNNDLLYDVNYDLVKSVKVYLDYDFVTSLKPSYETSKESYLPASEDQEFEIGRAHVWTPVTVCYLQQLVW
jgi:hypothetical protein